MQSFIRCVILLGIGTALQFLCGDIDNSLLHYPWSLILALNYSYLLVLLYNRSAKSPFLQSLFSPSFCISLLVVLTLMVICMGLSGLSIQRSWTFCIFMCCLMTAVGLMLVDDLFHVCHRSLTRTLSHVGIFLFLIAALFGSADMQKVKVTTRIDCPTWSGQDEVGNPMELPFQLCLKRFSVEEYAPTLSIRSVQESLSVVGSLAIPSDTALHQVGDWHVRVVQYIPEAIYNRDKDSVMVMRHVGAAPAAYLQIFDARMRYVCQGWVSSGSFLFDPVTLGLPNGSILCMNTPMSKSFHSDVWLTGAEGERHQLNLSVNHPARYGMWHFYQMGYDTERGKWSDISILECVCDPWHVVKQVALWLLLMAALFAVAGKNPPKNQAWT